MLCELRVTWLIIIDSWVVHSLVTVLSKLETRNPELRSIPKWQNGHRDLQSTCHHKRCLYTMQQMLLTSLNIFLMFLLVLFQNRNIISLHLHFYTLFWFENETLYSIIAINISNISDITNSFFKRFKLLCQNMYR